MKNLSFMLAALAASALALAQNSAAQTLRADDIVERLAPPADTVRTRSMGARAFRLEPRKLDFQIGFDFDSARIGAESAPQLDEIAKAMSAERLAATRFRIEGHTDATGTSAYNDSLSERRARAVVEFLQARGIAVSRLEAEGKGMRELADPNNPGAAANRRVRIVTLD